VGRVLLAEAAVLAHFETVRIVLLVFHGVIIALLALAARNGDSGSHRCTPDLPSYLRHKKKLHKAGFSIQQADTHVKSVDSFAVPVSCRFRVIMKHWNMHGTQWPHACSGASFP
jgi:hypothetical protein